MKEVGQKLLRQANDIIGQILLVAFFVIMGGVPLTIVCPCYHQRGARRHAPDNAGAANSGGACSLVFLTYVVVMIFIMAVFSLPYPQSRADEVKSTAIFLVSSLIYAAAGAALIYWTRAQARLSRPPT